MGGEHWNEVVDDLHLRGRKIEEDENPAASTRAAKKRKCLGKQEQRNNQNQELFGLGSTKGRSVISASE